MTPDFAEGVWLPMCGAHAISALSGNAGAYGRTSVTVTRKDV